MQVLVSKYKAENPNNQLNFSIEFSFDDISKLLYLAILNVYRALIVGFVLQLTIISNRKLHIMSFCELLCLVSNFLLPLSPKFQSSFSHFLKLLLNLHKIIAALLFVLKSLVASCTLDPLYYTIVESAATNESIIAILPDFIEKITETEDKYLWSYIINLMNELKPL